MSSALARLHGSIAIIAFLGTAEGQQCRTVIPLPSGLNPTQLNGFGSALAGQDDLLVVGASNDNQVPGHLGAVYIYDIDPVTGLASVVQVLRPSETGNRSFANAIALDGDVLAVSASGDDDAAIDAGAIHVYRRVAGVWTQEAKLTSSQAVYGMFMGWDIDVSGDIIVAGAPSMPGGGAVCVFERRANVWVETGVIRIGPPPMQLSFGQDVATGDGRVFAFGSSTGTPNSGTYVYAFDLPSQSWVLETVLPGSANFDVDGARAALPVPAPGPANSAIDFYLRDPVAGWQLDATRPRIHVAERSAQCIFVGDRVSLLGHGQDNFVSSYQWSAGAWNHLGTATAVGSSLDIQWFSGLAVAASRTFVRATPTGFVSVPEQVLGFRHDCDVVGLPGCTQSARNSTGFPGHLTVTGSAQVALNHLSLTASQLPIGSFGFFVTSRTSGLTVTPGNSQGNLCLGGNIGRFVGPGQIGQASSSGAFTVAIDLGVMPGPLGSSVAAPGEVWHFQFWHRDANPVVTSNFTHSVRLQLQ